MDQPPSTPSSPSASRSGVVGLLCIVLGAAIVGVLLALGVRRRDLLDDNVKPATRADDAAPVDAHGHHEITAEMIEAAEREKRKKREADLAGGGFVKKRADEPASKPPAPAGDDVTPIIAAPVVAGEGVKA